MQLNELQRKTPRQTKKRVGRGGLRGKTSGRGTKGQKARAGHRIRPEVRDMVKKIPKLRGHGKNRGRTINDSVIKPETINLSLLETSFASNEAVTPEALLEKGLVRRQKGGVPQVKILGTGTVSKKLSVSGCMLSESARSAIEKAGGSIA